MRSARVFRSTLSALLPRWRKLRDAPPTQKEHALALLEETVRVLEKPVATPDRRTNAIASPDCSSLSPVGEDQSGSGADHLPPGKDIMETLLGDYDHSLLIWKTLRRQRVPWEATLRLAEMQLQVIPAWRRRFVEQQSRSMPWSVSKQILVSWHLPEDSLREVHRNLKRAPTTVAFATAVTAALRPRPELEGLLPIPSGVLRHLYKLGCADVCSARIALGVCQHIALSDNDIITTANRELLTLQFAQLYARQGEWSRALAIVQAEGAVRLAIRKRYKMFVDQRMAWAHALRALKPPSAEMLASAILAAPQWELALKVYCRYHGCSAAATALLQRSDVVRALGWKKGLAVVAALPPKEQKYTLIRQVLEAVSPADPQFILVCAAALHHSARRMYSGTLTRRLFSFQQKGEWARAIALCCAAGYYDVALPFTAALPRGGHYELPAELLTYEKTVVSLQQPDANRRGCSSSVQYGDLTFAQLLARALNGDHVGVLRSPRSLADERLRSFLSAMQMERVGGDELGCVHCYTFQSAAHTQRVFTYAPEKERRYFLKVIPPALRSHHMLSLDASSQLVCCEETAIQRLEAFMSSSHLLSSAEECDRFCRLVVHYVRETVEGSANAEEDFLRVVARVIAAGRVALDVTDRYVLPLAALRACGENNVRLDASTTVRMYSHIPSQHADACKPALDAVVNALNLLGRWEAVLHILSRQQRRHRDELTSLGGAMQQPIVDGRLMLSDSFVKTAYYAPRQVALRLTDYLWRTSRNPLALMVQELLHGDSRQTREEICHLTSPSDGESDRRASQRRSQLTAQRKRALLSASFCLLHTETALVSVVSASKQEKISPSDVDEHALQRLLRVLPSPMALAALREALRVYGTVDEHWVAVALSKPDVTMTEVRSVAGLRPYSAVAASLCSFREALGAHEVVRALKCLLRYFTATEVYDHSLFLFPLSAMLKQFVEADGIEAAITAEPENGGPGGQQRPLAYVYARSLFNRLLQNAQFTSTLRKGRQHLPILMSTSELHSPILLLGYLHHVLARHLQVPISASFSSRLLRLASEKTHDWMSALHFFKCIRHPVRHECSQLVYALRNTPEATRVLLGTKRFVYHNPEQLIIWSDPFLGPEKWVASLRAMEAAAEDEKQGRTGVLHTSKLIGELTERWNRTDCERAMELARRMGISESRAPPVGQPSSAVDFRTKMVIDTVEARQSQCLMPSPPTTLVAGTSTSAGQCVIK